MLINIKGLVYRYIFALVLFTMMIISLMKIESMQAIVALRTILGGFPLVRPLSIASFILFIALIQYISLEYVLYMLKNDIYLMFRYVNRKKMFYVMIKEVTLLNGILAVIIGIAVGVSKCIYSESLLSRDLFIVIEIVLRGYLMTLIISIIQVALLVIIGEENTFTVILGINLCLICISRINFNIFSIVPVKFTNTGLLIINIVFNIAIIIVGIVKLEKYYCMKGTSNIC